MIPKPKPIVMDLKAAVLRAIGETLSEILTPKLREGEIHIVALRLYINRTTIFIWFSQM
jgi:hypothetical protein